MDFDRGEEGMELGMESGEPVTILTVESARELGCGASAEPPIEAVRDAGDRPGTLSVCLSVWHSKTAWAVEAPCRFLLQILP